MFTSRRWPLALVLSASAFAVIAFAQNPVIQTKAKLKQDVAVYGVVTMGDPQVLYTVPDDRTFVLTDLTITNINGESGLLSLLRDDQFVLQNVSILPGNTFEHTFGNGLKFPAGSTVKGYGPSDLTMRLNLIGYLKKD